MPHYLWKSMIGDFVFDQSFNIAARGKAEELKKKFPDASAELGPETERKILKALDDKKLYADFYSENLKLAKKAIRDSVKADNLIIQAVSSLDELDKSANIIVKRLREWYELYNPEFSNSIQSHEKFTELILSKSKKELLKQIGLKQEDVMGADLGEADLSQVMDLAKALSQLYALRKTTEKYIETIMKKEAPNVTVLAGATIGARLVAQAGSLQRMVEFPASTIQLLGAEKALFRHMKTGAKCPKFGLIYTHPMVMGASVKNKGKAARMLADKISIAAKVDYFKGEYMGDKLLKQLETKIGSLK